MSQMTENIVTPTTNNETAMARHPASHRQRQEASSQKPGSQNCQTTTNYIISLGHV